MGALIQPTSNTKPNPKLNIGTINPMALCANTLILKGVNVKLSKSTTNRIPFNNQDLQWLNEYIKMSHAKGYFQLHTI